MPPLAESVRDTLLPVETPLPVRAVESVKVTLPVVLKVTLGVARLAKVIAPDVEVKEAEVVPVTVPEPVIEPEPVAVMVSTVPETLALIAIGALVPVLTRARVPLAVME